MNSNKIFALEIFCLLTYLFLVGSVLCSLGQVNKEVRTIIYKHYGVEEPHGK